MSRNVLLLAAAVVLVAACACGPSSAAKSPIVIGAIFSTTGDNAPLGVPERETVEMLVSQINKAGGIKGTPVRVEFYNDEGDPAKAAQACQKLLAMKNVVAVIGPTLTGPSLAIVKMCNEAKVPLVSCAASVKIVQPVTPYVFKTAQSDSLVVGKLIDYLKKKGIKKVGFINDSNAFGASGREQWNLLSPKAGIQTLAQVSFSTGDTDMTSQLTSIREKKPQAVVCWGTNPGPSMVAKNMRQLGMKQPLYMSHGIANKKFIELAGSAAEGVIFPGGKLIVADFIPASDPQKKVLLKYARDFRAATGKPANTFGGHAWDAFNLVTSAVAKVGPNRSKVRGCIEKTRGFVGISGVFNFSKGEHNGLDGNAVAVIQISGGTWKLAK